MKQLRIIISNLGVGGAERHLTHILPALADLGWQIQVITINPGADLAPLLDHPRITLNFPPVWMTKLPRFLRVICGFFRLCWFFLKDRKSTTHFFLPESYLMGMCAAVLTRLKCPLVMSRRSLNNYQKNYFGLATLERFFHKRVDYILGNSQAVLNQLMQEEGVSPTKLKLIYNGLNLNHFQNVPEKTTLRKEFHIGSNDVVFVSVANLIPYKGHMDLLEALGKIAPKLPANWVLLSIGRDEHILEMLKAKAQDLGIADHIKWLGQRQDVVPLLFMSDVGILCSHQEGFSNALLEMMAAGLGIVATNVGGNSEAIQDQVSGIIVPPKDPQSLGEVLLKLATDKALRDQYGKIARTRAFDAFSLKHVINMYHHFYKQIDSK